MKPHIRHCGDFRWESIPQEGYKGDAAHHRGVTRQVLFGGGPGAPHDLRYFEVEPEGYTTLEHHDHVHEVMVLRGAGRVLVGGEIFDVAPFDLVHVPPQTWHQFRAGAGASLGFLCLVDNERDRPVLPTERDLTELRRSPEISEFIRV